MKIRQLITALFLIVLAFCSRQGQAQGVASLYVAAMPGFPDLPLDTAYEGQSYTYDLIVVNNTNIFINSTIEFKMMVDTATTTFLTNPQTAIQPGDSLIITVSGYNFTQPQFKMGNNIVVVWPVVNGLVVPVDSFNTNVFFLPLNSLGGIDLTEPDFHLYPVPSHDMLYLDISNDKAVEYVRIYSVSGQLLQDIPFTRQEQVDIRFLNPGIYVLEISANGKSNRIKFIRN